MSREYGRFFTSNSKARRMLFGLSLPLSIIVLHFLMSAAVLSADSVVLSSEVGYTACDADINGDGSVNFLDLAIAIDEFFVCSGLCEADINNDSDVTSADLAIMHSFWFQECVVDLICPPCTSATKVDGQWVFGSCPAVTLDDGTECNKAITSITIHGLEE